MAKRLGFGTQDIADIEARNISIPDQAKSFVMKWISKSGSEATYKKLNDLLMELGKQGAAETMLDIAKERYAVVE